MLTRSKLSIQKEIYNRISYMGTASKADLMQYFPLTSSSMTRTLDDMTTSGKIIISGLGNSTGGRKPILFQTNPTYRYLFGLEISRIKSSLGLYDMHLNRLASVRWIMDAEMTPERLVELVAEEAKRFMSEYHIQPQDMLGIGIGAVGPLDARKGIILKPELFPSAAWVQVPICDMLQERLNIPAILDNGSNTALIGEHWALHNEELKHMLYVHAGASIRSAMMSGGSIVRGAVDTESAIGQMVIQADGPRLREGGNYGALEAYVSVPALEHRVRSQLKLGRPSLLSGLPLGEIHFSSLIEALEQEDALVKSQFAETAAYLGIGLANLINALHPEYVILGGALINAHSLVYETAIEVAKSNLYHYPEYSPHFSQGQLLDEAVAMGAAAMLLHEWEG